MIVSMRKVTILSVAESREETVRALYDLGVLHVSNVQPPAGSDLEGSRRCLDRIRQASALLEAIPSAEGASGAAGQRKADIHTADAVAKEVLALAEARENADLSLKALREEYERLRPFGDFDPETIRHLKAGGVEVRFYEASEKKPPSAPEGTVVISLGREGGQSRFAVVGPSGAFDKAEPESGVQSPMRSSGEVNRLIAEKEKEIAEIAEKLRGLKTEKQMLDESVLATAARVRFLEVRQGMGATESVVYLQGFCPLDCVPGLQKAAAAHGWGLVASYPAPGDPTPTLIRYSRWVRPIQAVFDFLQVFPGYREADISGVFLLFFSLFFAMLIGDAGYGLLFLGLTVLARMKFPKAPRHPFSLLAVLSVCAIIWGVLTGNYFGVTDLPAPLKKISVDWLADSRNVMGLCFLIGAIHLTIAHVWNATALFPHPAVWAQAGWIAVTWTMFLGARSMVLQRPFPLFGIFLFGIGALLIVVFMTPWSMLRREWVQHAMLPLNFISCFVDIVSYIRLFAVGMATLAVAQNFNQMAMNSVGFDSLVAGFVAALVLAAGHTLNILLCALAVLVHGVRLNTLEFSIHKGMEWSGIPYDPFARKGEEPDHNSHLEERTSHGNQS